MSKITLEFLVTVIDNNNGNLLGFVVATISNPPQQLIDDPGCVAFYCGQRLRILSDTLAGQETASFWKPAAELAPGI